ncbi:chitobiase/beta-hexosaminidase C-terminal domain-containing protein [Akkermansiaceae bacterium]|nr:chitobiase/beta-hexosaminidase C-terminal domain-containing protein [Akkermansiaceae bacterium]
MLLVEDTNFSHKRGYYTAPFDVTISTDTIGTTIRYTTDGTIPTLSNGSTYSAPINIATTTVLRARAYKTGQQETDVDTQSYIFPVDVATQTKPGGYPNNWANNDYNVDTAISQSDS